MPFHAQILETFTRQVYKSKDHLFLCVQGFREILRSSRTRRRNSRVTYFSRQVAPHSFPVLLKMNLKPCTDIK